MTTLHDRLADLAEDAPSGGPEPELWDRGRRWHRRRRFGTAVIVAVVVVLLGSVAFVDWQRSAPVPAPARAPIGLPDRVWTPSPWLPTTSTPGQLVAIAAADRGSWTGKEATLAGISATTGEYSFLDLPDADGSTGAAELAPDGRHVAYWLTGDTTGTPNSESGPITGLATYDLTTGEVTRHWISTAHGLTADLLAWADSDTLVYSAGQVVGGDDASGMDQSLSMFGAVTSWALGSDPRPVVGVADGAGLEGAAHGRILVSTGGPRATLIDLAGRSGARRIDRPATGASINGLHFVALDASGDRIAFLRSDRDEMLAGRIGAERSVPDTEVMLFGIVDWLDTDTIVAFAGDREVGLERSGLFRISLSTGRSEEVVDLRSDLMWQFATDLVGAPSVHAQRPPAPLDPRLVAGSAGFVIVLGGTVLVLWRRRVRA